MLKALLFFCLLLLPVAAIAGDDPFHVADTPFYKQLDGFTGYNMPVLQIAQKIRKKLEAEPNKASVAMKWAEDKSFGVGDASKVNGLYFLIYADLNLASMPGARMDMDSYKKYAWTAFQSVVTLEALLMTDAARCSGVDAKPAAAKLLGPRYIELMEIYRLFPKEKIQSIWSAALDLEAAAAKRPGNPEVCSNSLSETEAETDTPDAAITPAYIDDAAWNKSREAVRQQLKTYWQQRYDEAVKK